MFTTDDDQIKALQKHIQEATVRFEKRVRAFYTNPNPSTMAGKTLLIIKAYPAERPTSRYRRTFRLQRSWRLTAYASTNRGEIQALSNTPYAQEVMGERQSPFFASRGWIASPVIAEALHADNERELGELWTEVTTWA